MSKTKTQSKSKCQNLPPRIRAVLRTYTEGWEARNPEVKK